MSIQDRRPVEVDTSLRNCCERVEKCLKFLLPLILLAIYSLVGGFVFHLIEEPKERQTRLELSQNLTNSRNDVVEKLLGICYENTPNRVERFSEEVMKFHKKLGVQEGEGEFSWNFWGSTLYAMTLYTTIGYGNIAPKTTEGQVLTLFYSIIGIPLCLAALVQVGIMVAYGIIALWSCMAKYCCRRPSARGDSSAKSTLAGVKQRWLPVIPNPEQVVAEQDVDLLNLPVSVLIFATVAWTLGVAGLFCLWEDYGGDYFKSLYFTIISFSTIGLGDVVPTNQNFYVLDIVFFMIGLALLSTVFAVLQQQLEALKNSLKRAIDQEFKESQMDGQPGAVVTPGAKVGADSEAQLVGAGHRMTVDAHNVDAELKKMVNKLPVSTRFLYWTMSEEEKNKLKQYWLQKAGLQSRGTQTDERWMRASYLERIGEEDDRRSHDDVNSLIAFCDYALPTAR